MGGRLGQGRYARRPGHPPRLHRHRARWLQEQQKQYGYSAREHAIVLNSLRDACRRFSIDTDRVYLSGQSIGGDAAWDIGLAHPDLWAGVIPIVAQSDRYCARYWENARYVPFYVVAGELDGSKLINERPRSRSLPPSRLQLHGRRVPRPGARGFLRRDSAAFRLDGPLPSKFLPPGVHLRDDATVGQFLLVGGSSGAAAPITGRSERLAAAGRHAALAGEGKDHRPQRPYHPRRHNAGDGMALAQDARFQPAGHHHGKRPAA